MKGLGGLLNERDYRNFTLSDRNVVKYLILYRNKLDVTYSGNKNIAIENIASAFEFNQELIALYASLDTIIDLCDFEEKQIKLLELLYEGNKIYDICNMNIGYTRSATYELLDRMIDKIVKINDELWLESMRVQGHIK